MIAHNIYFNLDIGIAHSSIKKLKAYFGSGNNCNMVKGLIKRRYWWTVSDELTEDCLFVWTQLKVNKIFERQERGIQGKSIYKLIDTDQDRRNSIKTSVSARKRHTIETNLVSKNKEESKYRIGSLWN